LKFENLLEKVTPALLRYKQLKEENPTTVLLYRMGDFYEAFFEDAVTISRVLDIALTSRDKGPNKTPMAGLPYHALEAYLGKLIDAGYKVAIAEQEETKVVDETSGKTKIVIHRNLAKIVTPSTYERESDYNAHFLVSISLDNTKEFIVSKDKSVKLEISFSCIDPNGSNFWTTTFESIQQLDNELFRLNPSEVLIQTILLNNIMSLNFISKNPQSITTVDKASFINSENTLKHFKVKSLRAYGIETEQEILAANACFNYIEQTQHSSLSHIHTIQHKVLNSRMRVDSNTIRNLEIVSPSTPGGTSLMQILDNTHTRGGKRLLKDWITAPLSEYSMITERLNSIKYLYSNDNTEIISQLSHIYDLERVCARISFNSVSPRDLISLAQSIEYASKLPDYLPDTRGNNIEKIKFSISDSTKKLSELIDIIRKSLIDPAPSAVKDGHFIKDGVSSELDDLRQITSDSKKWLRNLEIMEQQKTGINTLRVKYNRVFGYFLEVSKGQISKVPETYIRKQTTVNGERYITTELKEKESMILGAKDRVIELENELYKELIEKTKKYTNEIIILQNSLSELDVYVSLTTASQMNNYCFPNFTNEEKKSAEIHAIDARHPMIERITKETYIYNDIHIQSGEMILITGPNMGGKSTYIRMVALIAYMAHIGCYVPAKECTIGVIDSIFTRVGASDDISKGESTFMVEMTEAANILRNATEKSLVILDEIGRGTSTYDGMSIAWAIVYYMHEHIRAKTLFATHYHELTVLEGELNRMSNYTVAISEDDGEVVFLRKIKRGKAEKSFGIHVAKLAGLPQEVLDKATEVLTKLEVGDNDKDSIEIERQMGLWEFVPKDKNKIKEEKPVAKDKILNEENDIIKYIKDIDINSLTPVNALIKLEEIKKKLVS